MTKICHIPPGNPANAHEITIGEPAIKAHLAHGDTLGDCIATITPIARKTPPGQIKKESLPASAGFIPPGQAKKGKKK